LFKYFLQGDFWIFFICNLPPATQAELVEKFSAAIVDTGGKFAAGVIDTGGSFATGVINTGGKFATGVNNTGGAP
jgi:hypothetical protein